MAGERIGKAYEAVVHAALLELKRQGLLNGDLFWNKKPAGMTIEPDFTIGPDPDHPKVLILVTHSGAAGNSHMKFWRNLGELVEAKTRLPTVPRVFSVLFDAVVKDDLKAIQAAAFDGQIVVGDKSYGAGTEAWVAERRDVPLDGIVHEAQAVYRASSNNNPCSPNPSALDGLLTDLETMLYASRPELDQLWDSQRQRQPGRVPAARRTSVRRGLSKLLIFEDFELAIRLYRGGRVTSDEVPQYAYDLGLAGKGLIAKPGDPEIQSVFRLLPDKQIRQLIASSPIDSMMSWLELLRNTEQLQVMGQYVADSFAQLCDPNLLACRLAALHTSPAALVSSDEPVPGWPPGTVWLFEYLLELTKASARGANAYGLAQLAREAEKLPGMPAAGHRVYRIVLPDWVHRRGAEVLDHDTLAGISKVLAQHLREIGPERIAGLAAALPQTVARNVVETKLVTYRGFDPLGLLVRWRLTSGVPRRVQAGFAGAVMSGGQAAKTQVLQVGHALVNWQSVSDAGRDHKKKELCGRAVALRYSWDPAQRRFLPRPGVEKLILLLDGTWRQGDLEALSRAGWDDIFYPDEMEQLAKAIV